MNASEPLSYASKTLDRRHQNQGLGALLRSVRRPPIYRSHGVRCREGMAHTHAHNLIRLEREARDKHS
jgi:hypothetical protein